MRLYVRLAIFVAFALLHAPACLAQTANADQRARAAHLQKLATDVKELSRCMGLISVEDSAAFAPLRLAYHRKTDELAKAIEDYVARYKSSRGNKQETESGFRYRIWDLTLQAGTEKARAASALNRDTCSGLAK